MAILILTYRYLPQRASGRAMEQVAGPEGRNKERKKSKKASRREKKTAKQKKNRQEWRKEEFMVIALTRIAVCGVRTVYREL